MFRKQMKQRAKELLSGIWGRAIALLFSLAAVSVFFALLERTVASLTRLSTLEQLFSPLFFYGTVTVLPQTLLFSSILFVGASLLSFFFGTPLLQGNVSWYYKRTEGEIFPVFRAFLWYASFRKWLKVLVVYLLLFLKKAFWTVLLLLPAGILYFAYCISVIYRADAWQSFILFFLSTGLAAGGLVSALIVCYRYFLVPYILADNPKVRILTAFRSSVQIMKGKKAERFALDLSFLPYYLLNLLLVPMIGTLPYINMTKALFAKRYILDYQLDILIEKQETAEIPKV